MIIQVPVYMLYSVCNHNALFLFGFALLLYNQFVVDFCDSFTDILLGFWQHDNGMIFSMQMM